MKLKLLNKENDLYYWKGFHFVITKHADTEWTSHISRYFCWWFETRTIDIGGTCWGNSKNDIINQTKKRILELRKKLSFTERIALKIHKKEVSQYV